MWANLLYMLPVASILSECIVEEEIKMEGELSEELDRLFKAYIPHSKLRFVKKPLHAHISATYPAGTSLWTIFDTIIARFHLVSLVEVHEDYVKLAVTEGNAWKH